MSQSIIVDGETLNKFSVKFIAGLIKEGKLYRLGGDNYLLDADGKYTEFLSLKQKVKE